MSYKLIIQGKKEKAIFSNLFFNEDDKLEFKSCSIPRVKGTAVFQKEERKLLLTESGALLALTDEQAEKLTEIEEKIRTELLSLYKNIVSGDEKLIFFKIDVENYPYLITTKTILEADFYSPKYTKALAYATSDACLKRFNFGIYPGFKNYEDMQEKLGKKVKKLKIKPNENCKGIEVISITLKDLLKREA